MADPKIYTVVVVSGIDDPMHTIYHHARNVDIANSPGGISSFTTAEGKICRTNAMLLAEEE